MNQLKELPSAKRLDPTDDSSYPSAPPGVTLNDTTLYGAQALVRVLDGKDLKGYVDPKKARKVFGRNDPQGDPPWFYEHPDTGEEEERRLFYVALTRAKDELYLTYPTLNPRSYTGEIMQTPSRFFDDFDVLYGRWNRLQRQSPS